MGNNVYRFAYSLYCSGTSAQDGYLRCFDPSNPDRGKNLKRDASQMRWIRCLGESEVPASIAEASDSEIVRDSIVRDLIRMGESIAWTLKHHPDAAREFLEEGFDLKKTADALINLGSCGLKSGNIGKATPEFLHEVFIQYVDPLLSFGRSKLREVEAERFESVVLGLEKGETGEPSL